MVERKGNRFRAREDWVRRPPPLHTPALLTWAHDLASLDLKML